MTKDDASLNTKLLQRVLEQRSMGSGRPKRARARAVAITRSLDDDYPITFLKPIHQAVDREILDQRPVAMNENQGLTPTTLDVMQPHAVNIEKSPDRRVLAFCFSRLLGRVDSRCDEGCSRAKDRRNDPRSGGRGICAKQTIALDLRCA